ncbi:MAG: DUF2007 domain-containing protein [Clostridia bacterium]|nr:DUF2007 domain-containing protein [Clostridia bacterium]
MDKGYEFLTEKEYMWAHLLMQVLEDNGIEAVAMGVNGAGMALRTGIQDSQRIFVPAEHLQSAQELLDQLFSGEYSDSQQ